MGVGGGDIESTKWKGHLSKLKHLNVHGYKIKIPTVQEVSASPERSVAVTARLGGNCWGGVRGAGAGNIPPVTSAAQPPHRTVESPVLLH